SLTGCSDQPVDVKGQREPTEVLLETDHPMRRVPGWRCAVHREDGSAEPLECCTVAYARREIVQPTEPYMPAERITGPTVKRGIVSCADLGRNICVRASREVERKSGRARHGHLGICGCVELLYRANQIGRNPAVARRVALTDLDASSDVFSSELRI